MSDTLSTTSTLDNLLSTYFVKKSLPRLIQKAVLYQYADKTPLPKGEGKTVVWNAWSNFAPVSAALGEGTNPSLAAVSSRKVTATISQYARGVKTSDLVEYTSSLDVMEGVVDNLSDSAGLSVDKVVQLGIFRGGLASNAKNQILSAWMSAVVSAFTSGSNAACTTNATWGFPVVFGTTATRLSAVSKTAPSVSARLSLYSIKKVVKTLRAKNAMEFADGYFKCVTNSDAIADLRTDPDYKNWHQYLENEDMKKGVVGTVEGVKVIQSNNLPTYRATAHSCDLTFIFGQGAYGCVTMGEGKGKGYEIIIKRPGNNDTSNPANMYGTMAFKFTMVAKALNTSSGRVLITHSKP